MATDVYRRSSSLFSNSNLIVAFAAFWVNFWVLGNLRSNAVLFKALVDVFRVNRESAAWPSGIFGFFMCVTGALSGFLSQYISIRNLTVFGAVLASVSVSACCLASHMHHIIFLYGALQGIGVGMVVPLTHVIINQTFTKYKACALGIAYSGSSVGSFIFPIFTNFLLSGYGLDGTFLLLGGIMLHSVAGALFYRTPKCTKQTGETVQALIRPSAIQYRQQGADGIQPVLCLPFDKSCLKRQGRNDTQPLRMSHPEELSFLQRQGTVCLMQNIKQIQQKEEVKEDRTRSPCQNPEKKVTSELSDSHFIESRKDTVNSCCWKLKPSLQMAVEILMNPHFLVVSVAYSVYFSTSSIFLMVALDFAQDRGVPPQEGVFLVSAFSIGDFAGRLSFGWIADTRCVPRNHLVRIYLLSMGFLTASLPLCPSKALSVAAVFLGVLNGSVIVNHSVLLGEYLGLDRLPIAMGFSTCLVGLTAFLRPIVIGIFRDQHMSYDNLFVFIGLLQVTVTLIWWAGTCVQFIRHRIYANKYPH